MTELRSDMTELRGDMTELRGDMTEMKATQRDHGEVLRAILARLDGRKGG